MLSLERRFCKQLTFSLFCKILHKNVEKQVDASLRLFYVEASQTCSLVFIWWNEAWLESLTLGDERLMKSVQVDVRSHWLWEAAQFGFWAIVFCSTSLPPTRTRCRGAITQSLDFKGPASRCNSTVGSNPERETIFFRELLRRGVGVRKKS